MDLFKITFFGNNNYNCPLKKKDNKNGSNTFTQSFLKEIFLNEIFRE